MTREFTVPGLVRVRFANVRPHLSDRDLRAGIDARTANDQRHRRREALEQPERFAMIFKPAGVESLHYSRVLDCDMPASRRELVFVGVEQPNCGSYSGDGALPHDRAPASTAGHAGMDATFSFGDVTAFTGRLSRSNRQEENTGSNQILSKSGIATPLPVNHKSTCKTRGSSVKTPSPTKSDAARGDTLLSTMRIRGIN